MASQTGGQLPKGRAAGGGKFNLGSYVEPELYEAVQRIAEHEGRTMAQVVRRAVEAEVERQAA